MRRRPTLLLGLVVLVAVLPSVAAAASAPAPNERTIAAKLVYEKREADVHCGNCGPGGSPIEIPTCTFGIWVQFPKVSGATGYRVTYRDGSSTLTVTGPPYADDVDPGLPYKRHFKAPKGTHRLGGLTGGSGPAANCLGDPTYNGRFAIKKAVATCPAGGGGRSGVFADAIGPIAVATASKPADCGGSHIKGQVTDSFGEGVDNVRVVARGKGGSKQSITSDDGQFDIRLADLKSPATYTVTASNKLYRQIDPKVRTVTARPGKDAFARFTVATGKLRGTVRELVCTGGGAALARKSCKSRKPIATAVVELRGDQVGTKFARVGADGTYSFKVPVGSYDLRVNSATATDKGGADVCKENAAIPVAGDDDAVTCDRVVDVQAGKGAVKTVDFLAVPRVMLAELRLLTFDGRDRPRETASVLSGLDDPTDPELFGSYGSGSGRRDFPVVRCRTGCVTIEAVAHDLLGRPVKTASFADLRATPISPDLAASDDNDQGVACFAPRNVPDRRRRRCLPSEEADNDGRALGIYAAPGVVPGAVLAKPDGAVTTTITTLAMAPRYEDAPLDATLTIRPNPRVGKPGVDYRLSQKDADELNVITDPNSVKQGFVNLARHIPEACGEVTQWLFERRIRGISDICDVLETPSNLSAPALENYVDLVGAMYLLSRFDVRPEGLVKSFGIRLDEIPTSVKDAAKLIPRSTTPAARFLSDFLNEWRLEQGDDHIVDGATVREPIKRGERVRLRIFEISHYAVDDGELVRVPAVLLSLQADLLPTPKTVVISGGSAVVPVDGIVVGGGDGYDPLTWLK